MNSTTLYIEKSSQTFADILATFGLAYLVNVVTNDRTRVRMEDIGYALAVICECDVPDEWMDEATFFTGAPFLVTVDRSSQQKMVKGTDLSCDDLPISNDVVVDYEIEKARNSQFYEWLKSLSKEDRKQHYNRTLLPPVSPHLDWDLFRAINPNALQVYNGLVGMWWQSREAFADVLRILFHMTAQVPNDIAGAEKAWEALCKRQGWPVEKRSSANQLFNPAQGKGTNATKAVWASPNNRDNFWLLEYLKVVGMRYGGFSKLVRGSKDRKTYVLAPNRLGWQDHDSIMAKFRQRMAGQAGAIQMDVLASLRYTQTLIEHYEGAREVDLAAEFLGRSATDLVQGMQTAFYKDMGNAVVTMNIASIGLPEWVRPQTAADLQRLKVALAEHEQIVRMMDESHSDQYDLLKYYRDFLSGGDLTAFFKFSSAYSSFVIHQLERRQPVRLFTTTTLEVLFMNSDDAQKSFSQILQDPGFQNIAYAIRYSTVIPQSRKGKGNRPRVEIRYGLGQQLTRKAAYPADFLAEVTGFIHLYNAENAQLREHKREPFRKNVTTADIAALTSLVDTFGAKVVCNLLVAFGYAREPFEKDTETVEEPLIETSFETDQSEE